MTLFSGIKPLVIDELDAKGLKGYVRSVWEQEKRRYFRETAIEDRDLEAHVMKILDRAEEKLKRDTDPRKAKYRELLCRPPNRSKEAHTAHKREIANIIFLASDTLNNGNLFAHMLREDEKDILDAAEEAPVAERHIVTAVAAAAIAFEAPKSRNEKKKEEHSTLQARTKAVKAAAEVAAAEAEAKAKAIRQAEIVRRRRQRK